MIILSIKPSDDGSGSDKKLDTTISQKAIIKLVVLHFTINLRGDNESISCMKISGEDIPLTQFTILSSDNELVMIVLIEAI